MATRNPEMSGSVEPSTVDAPAHKAVSLGQVAKTFAVLTALCVGTCGEPYNELQWMTGHSDALMGDKLSPFLDGIEGEDVYLSDLSDRVVAGTEWDSATCVSLSASTPVCYVKKDWF